MTYPILERELIQKYSAFWDTNEIEQNVFYWRLKSNRSFINCFAPYGRNLSQIFLNDVYRRTKGKIPLSIVWQIYGKQGSGKSKLSMEIARRIDPTFNADRIFLRRENLLNALKNAKSNTAYVLDEQKHDFGHGSERQLKELQDIEEITRIEQVHLGFNSPTLREHIAVNYTFEVLQKNHDQRLTKFAFVELAGHRKIYLGYGICKIPEDDKDPLYKAYEPRKRKFVEEVLQRKSQKYDVWEYAKKLKHHKYYQFARSKQDLVLISQSIFPNLTTGEHQNIVNALYFLRRKFHRKSRLPQVKDENDKTAETDKLNVYKRSVSPENILKLAKKNVKS